MIMMAMVIVILSMAIVTMAIPQRQQFFPHFRQCWQRHKCISPLHPSLYSPPGHMRINSSSSYHHHTIITSSSSSTSSLPMGVSKSCKYKFTCEFTDYKICKFEISVNLHHQIPVICEVSDIINITNFITTQNPITKRKWLN